MLCCVSGEAGSVEGGGVGVVLVTVDLLSSGGGGTDEYCPVLEAVDEGMSQRDCRSDGRVSPRPLPLPLNPLPLLPNFEICCPVHFGHSPPLIVGVA